MLGYTAAFVYLLLLTAGIYLFAYASRRASALYVTALEIAAGTVASTVIILFTEKLGFLDLFTTPTAENWLWLGAAALTGYWGGNYFSNVNLCTGGERINSLLSPAITVLAVLAAAIVFMEKMNWVKSFGILLTIAAVVAFLIFRAPAEKTAVQPRPALWSGIAAILCITFSIFCNIKGTQAQQISFTHSIWLRLLVALPFAIGLYLGMGKRPTITQPRSFYGAIAAGVLAQTILASYLWFYCTYAIGISVFQVIISTLPFLVYATDVYVFRKTKPSLYFIATAALALVGVMIVIWVG